MRLFWYTAADNNSTLSEVHLNNGGNYVQTEKENMFPDVSSSCYV